MNKRQILTLMGVAALILPTAPAHSEVVPGVCTGYKYPSTVEQTCPFSNVTGVVRVVGVTNDPLAQNSMDVKIYATADPATILAECSTAPGLPVLTHTGTVCSAESLNDLPSGEPMTCDITGGSGVYVCEAYA